MRYPDEARDVFASLAQRRERNREDAQPIVQVVAEGAVGDRLAQIPVRGRNDAHVHLLGGRRADALEAPFLQDAQQLGLEIERQIADFVEKQRPAMGQLESALARGDRARERAARVAEELAFDQRRRQRRAVDDDQRVAAPRPVHVDRAREQLLARAGLSQEQHSAGGRGDLVHARQRHAQRGAGADDAVEIRDRCVVVSRFLFVFDAGGKPLQLGAALAQLRILPAALQRAANQGREQLQPLQQGGRPRVRFADRFERERAHELAGDVDRSTTADRSGVRRRYSSTVGVKVCAGRSAGMRSRTRASRSGRNRSHSHAVSSMSTGIACGSERRVGPEQRLDHVAILAVLDERGAIDADAFRRRARAAT